MKRHSLTFPSGFDRKTQRVIGYAISDIEDQTRRLKKAVEGLTVEQLEWQPRSGFNTIGMLLAHIAVAEFYWLSVAARNVQDEAQGRSMIREAVGIDFDDDGLPLPADGMHPQVIEGRDLDAYLKMIDDARASSLAVLVDWTDDSLDEVCTSPWSEATREWILYHAVEHLTQHAGQIGLLLHLQQPSPGD